MRLGVIGCGRIGADASLDSASRLNCHAQGASDSSKLELAALCDTDLQRLKRAGERWGVRALYTDPMEMIQNQKLEVVSLCTPTATHAPIFKQLLGVSSLKGILLEKPAAAGPEEAALMLEWARRSSLTVSVNYGRRFCPAYRNAFEQIRQGSIGSLVYVHAIYTKGIYNNGTHMLDLLHWALGEPNDLLPVEEVLSDEDPTLSFRWNAPQGVNAWVQGIDHRLYNVFEIDFLGTKGRLRFVDQGHRLERYGVAEVASTYGFRQFDAQPQIEETNFKESVRFALEDLVSSIQDSREPACSLEHAGQLIQLASQLKELRVP